MCKRKDPSPVRKEKNVNQGSNLPLSIKGEMLINIPRNFPALELLAKEQTDFSSFIAFNANTKAQLTIAVLNLMPLKITTEADI